MTRFVFLIGHPASGKSTLYDLISFNFKQMGQNSCRLNDRDFFFAAIAHDVDHQYHVIQPGGTIKVTDPKLFELQFLNFGKVLRNSQWSEEWVFAELTSTDYQKTLQLLGSEFISTCVLILVSASQDVALRRNNKRPLHSDNVDLGRIPEDYIRECFKQNLESLPGLFKKSFHVDNDYSDTDHLSKAAAEIVLALTEMTTLPSTKGL